VAGGARYQLREPRPLLTAELKSQTLDLADLGPLIGLKTSGLNRSADGPAVKADGKKTPVAQGDAKKAGTAGTPEKKPSTAQAQAKATPAARTTASTSGRLFPDAPFNLQKLNTMDADVKVAAARLRLPEQVPLKDFSTSARLDAGVLKLEPLNFGFAGGEIVANVVLDARNDPLAGNVAVDFKRIKLSELFPTLDKLKQSGGSLGAQVRLAGRGNSVAALLGSSNGTVAAGMAGGLVSEIAVWLINLNGGELIPLLFGGDRPTPVRCGAAVLDVKDGLGNFSLFVFDTEESRIGGSGTVDLKNERLDITLRPQAKKPGIGSIRGPIHIHGSFRDVDFAIAPQSIARGLGAIALGLVNPVLSLLPLVETGSGEDANCREVLQPVKGAVQQSGKSVSDAPADEGKRGRDSPAPVVEVPGKGSPNGDRQPAAPIVDVPAKKQARASGG
jgi:AsmA protein